MKKIILTLMLLTLVFALFANTNIKVLHPKAKVLSTKNGTRNEIYYQETFEGDQTWTTQDGTLPTQMWHLDDFNTPDGTGLSWWMGDPELGGYINHLYLVLDTDPITVPTNGHLTFDLNYSVENPAGATAPWDGWDGCDVRISTDDGDTWQVISGSPAYNCQSMYSFGFEHGEGEGIAGWGGSSNGWVNADFDLSAYAGQNVKIRFAFASDPAYCTEDNPDLFGMIVDNIQLGSFSNDGVETGMTASSMVPVGGDIWHLGEVADAPSPTHAMICQNDQGTYNPNMIDYWISDTITLPQSDQIIADFMIKGNFNDPDQFPEVDYFGWEITPDNGLHWYAMSNPYGDPNGSNYVYSDAPETWSSMVESYDGVDGDISNYAGQDVKFRIYFQSDGDTPDGTGIMIDDFTISYTVGAPATNLAADLTENGNVHLTWTAPGSGGGQAGWIHWDNGENNDGIGTNGAAVMDAAARFTSSELIEGQITKIKFFPKEENCTYTLKVWRGTSGSEEIYSQAVDSPVIDDWNEIDLTTPVPIDPANDYYIGYTADAQTGYPLGCDAGPMVPDRGGYIRLNGGAWGQLTDYGLDCNWNIQAYLEGTTGQLVVMNPREGAKDITGYEIFRSTDNANFDLIDTIEPAEEYTDEIPVVNTTNYYYVKVLYNGQESAPSNTVNIFVPDLSGTEIAYDDGSAEDSIAPQSGEVIAVKFTPEAGQGGYHIHYAKVYITDLGTASQILVRVYNVIDDEPNMVFQYTYSTDLLVTGWNFIPIPDDYATDAVFDSDFYVGLFALPGTPYYGVDTDTSGNSYLYSSAAWQDYNNGNAMIRVLGTYGDNAEPNSIVEAKISSKNYPNPFNPTTTISYNVPMNGNVTVEIYNMLGQKVKTLVNEQQKAGLNKVVWNGTDERGKTVSSGIYLYKIKNGKYTSTKKMILMK